MMIHLQLPTELENELRRQAQKNGSEIDKVILDALKKRFKKTDASKKTNLEAALLKKTSIGFPDAFWSRYAELTAKKGTENIAPAELEELISMQEKIDLADAERIEACFELAILRGREPRELMIEMGIYRQTA